MTSKSVKLDWSLRIDGRHTREGDRSVINATDCETELSHGRMVTPSKTQLLEPRIVGVGNVDFSFGVLRGFTEHWLLTVGHTNEGKNIPFAVLGLPAELDTSVGDFDVHRVSHDLAVGHDVASITKHLDTPDTGAFLSRELLGEDSNGRFDATSITGGAKVVEAGVEHALASMAIASINELDGVPVVKFVSWLSQIWLGQRAHH
jgi:hypothetical protein